MVQRNKILPLVALIALTVVTYLPVLRNGFIWDDDDHLTANPALKYRGGLQKIWSCLEFSRYYPLTLTTFWLQRRLWGLNPLPYHAVNAGLHGVSAAVLFVLLRKLNVRGAWVGAALWAVHPVNVESVAWVTELKNVQSGLFFFLTLLCFLRFEREPRRKWFVLSLLSFAAALLSKPSTVVLPLVLLLVVWWQRRRWQRLDFIRALPFVALSASMSLLTVIEQSRMIARGPKEWALSLTERLVLAGRALWFYAAKLLWPFDLSFVYPRWALAADSAAALLPLLAVVALGLLLWRSRGRGWARACLFGLGYFIIALLPVLGFFDIYFFRYSFVADHFQYLASVAMVALVTSGVSVLCRRKPVQVAVSALAIVLLGTLSWQRGHVFHDDETLWRDTLERNPLAPIAHNNLGAIFNGKKQYEQAIEQFREALRLKPDFYEPYCNLGLALTELGRYDEAERNLYQALRIKPDLSKAHYCLGKLYLHLHRLDDAIDHYLLAIRFEPTMPEAYFELGTAWQELGRRENAMQCYRAALALRPDYALANNNLGNMLAENGRLEEAVRHYRSALEAMPELGKTEFNLGMILVKLNRIEEAIQHLRRATQLAPDFADGYVQLAKLLTRQGHFAEAISTLKSGLTANSPNPIIGNEYAWLLATCPLAELRNAPQAIQIGEELSKATDRKAPQPLDTLAAAYAEAGRFDEAVVTAREAYQVAEEQKQTALAEAIRGRIDLYEDKKPFRLDVTRDH